MTSEYRLDKNTRINGRPSREEEDIMLVDVRSDPGETRNLTGDPSYQAVQANLVAMLDSHTEHALESDMTEVYASR